MGGFGSEEFPLTKGFPTAFVAVAYRCDYLIRLRGMFRHLPYAQRVPASLAGAPPLRLGPTPPRRVAEFAELDALNSVILLAEPKAVKDHSFILMAL
jgi:hypothetical protein